MTKRGGPLTVDFVSNSLDAVRLGNFIRLCDGGVIPADSRKDQISLCALSWPDSRVVPKGDVGVCFGHGLGHGQAQTVCGSRDDDDPSRHVELLQHLGRRVWERPGEAVPDHRAVFKVHGHFGGTSSEMRVLNVMNR